MIVSTRNVDGIYAASYLEIPATHTHSTAEPISSVWGWKLLTRSTARWELLAGDGAALYARLFESAITNVNTQHCRQTLTLQHINFSETEIFFKSPNVPNLGAFLLFVCFFFFSFQLNKWLLCEGSDVQNVKSLTYNHV